MEQDVAYKYDHRVWFNVASASLSSLVFLVDAKPVSRISATLSLHFWLNLTHHQEERQ